MRFACVLLVGCASLQRTPVPPDAAPLVAVMTSSSCPAYRIAVHEDGLVEYWADRSARAPGVGWLRVDAEVVQRLRSLPLQREWKIVDIDGDPWCRVYDASAIGLAIHGADGWTGHCAAVRFDREDEILRMLGVVRLLMPVRDGWCGSGV
jgi:hypothetical protein